MKLATIYTYNASAALVMNYTNYYCLMMQYSYVVYLCSLSYDKLFFLPIEHIKILNKVAAIICDKWFILLKINSKGATSLPPKPEILILLRKLVPE